MNKVQQLLEGLRACITFEKRPSDLKGYFLMMNATLNPTTPYKECGSCSALMKRYHSDFQKAIWRRIVEVDPRYVPELPKFETARMNNEYQQKTVPTLSFADIAASENYLRNEALKYKRSNNSLEYQRCINDAEALKTYRLVRLDYFEKFLPELEAKLEQERLEKEERVADQRDRLIDKDELLKMKEEGKSNVACAEHFGVSPAAISKMLKSLGYVKEKKNSN